MTKYRKMIEYLVQQDITHYKEDIQQELYLYVWRLCKRIEEKEIVPKNVDHYIFISLKRENQRLNQYYKQFIMLKKVSISTIEAKQHPNHLYTAYIKSLAEQKLSKKEYLVFDLYFNQGLSQKDISKKLDVSRQYIQKLIQIIIEKIKKNIF